MTTRMFLVVVRLLLPRTEGTQKYFRRFVCGFSHSGEFEFFRRFLPKPTSGAIGYYSSATFRGDDLRVLQAALERAGEALAAQPDEWREELDDPGLREEDERVVAVRKADVQETLEDFLWSVERGILQGGVIEFGKP